MRPRWAAFALTVAALLVPLGALAQTSTPTETPTPTVTSTPTSTNTPTINPHDVLARNETCASPPCDLAVNRGGAMHGNKTVYLVTTAGTATTSIICHPVDSYLESDVTLASMSGATCSTAANCVKESTTWCEELFLRITACSGCRVSAWLRNDRGAGR